MERAFEVDLNALIDIFDMPESFSHFLNKKNGKVESISEDFLDDDEDDDEDGEHSLEDFATDDYLQLNLKDDLDEFQIMRDFCASMRDANLQEALLFTIQGKGAFARFKQAINFHKIQNLWYRYRHQRVKQFVMQWCKQNGFAYKYERPQYLDEA